MSQHSEPTPRRPARRWSGIIPGIVVLSGAVVLGACGTGGPRLPSLRPLVVYSGARLEVQDTARLEEIHTWFTRAIETIETDPSFLLDWDIIPEEAYPWETLSFPSPDTVRIGFERAPDIRSTYWVYAFLHLMHRRESMDEWFPEAVGLDGWELERFIVDRTTDSWLLGRVSFDTPPYRPLDELVYAQDAGYLDALLLTARPDEFPEARETYEREHPGRLEEYREWFREVFEMEPPGLRDEGS